MIETNIYAYALSESLKQPKNEVKQGNAELFKRILKNEINKLQTDENYK